MLVWLAVILLVAWLLGWGVFHVAGGLIHLLLVVAVV
ncbi:MAG TPA: lmo0937 family membrane protein, partial [Gemmatimonadales bacterium]|nr:lmo0937 family membrane protein [Gemmatimonadales bacterium]